MERSAMGGHQFTAASVATAAKKCVADCLRRDLLGQNVVGRYRNASKSSSVREILPRRDHKETDGRRPVGWLLRWSGLVPT